MRTIDAELPLDRQPTRNYKIPDRTPHLIAVPEK